MRFFFQNLLLFSPQKKPKKKILIGILAFFILVGLVSAYYFLVVKKPVEVPPVEVPPIRPTAVEKPPEIKVIKTVSTLDQKMDVELNEIKREHKMVTGYFTFRKKPDVEGVSWRGWGYYTDEKGEWRVDEGINYLLDEVNQIKYFPMKDAVGNYLLSERSFFGAW